MTRRRRRRVGRAHRLAASRVERTYRTQMRKKKPSILDDYFFIWSTRTHHGQRRSWIQRLFRW